MIVISVDSNVACVAKQISSLLYKKAEPWCAKSCECRKIDFKSLYDQVVLKRDHQSVNTPISTTDNGKDGNGSGGGGGGGVGRKRKEADNSSSSSKKPKLSVTLDQATKILNSFKRRNVDDDHDDDGGGGGGDGSNGNKNYGCNNCGNIGCCGCNRNTNAESDGDVDYEWSFSSSYNNNNDDDATLDDTRTDAIFYDTPIAMCDDLDKNQVPYDSPVFYSFVFLDLNKQNQRLTRIKNNMTRLERLVVVSTPEYRDDLKGSQNYVIDPSYCGYEMVSRFMAVLINSFKHCKRTLHPRDLVAYFKGRTIKDIPLSGVYRCDLHEFSKQSFYSDRRDTIDCEYC